MHALEMLLPQQLQVTHVDIQTTLADIRLALPADPQAAATARHNSVPTSASPPIILQHSDLAFAAPIVSTSSQQQQLPSPASKLASKPFPGPPPVTLAQQQAPEQPLRQDQQLEPHRPQVLAAAAAAPAATPIGLLELSLSADQVALLQAAADNAQHYLDRDAANAGKNAEQADGASTGGFLGHNALSLC